MLSQERLLWIVQWMTNRTNIYLVLDQLIGVRQKERERERETERVS